MFNAIDTMIRIVSKVVLAVLIAIGLVMLAVSWAHIFCRYALNDSLSWSEELLKILLVWFCLLSATFISVRREHVRIVVFKQLLPKRFENLMDLFVSFLMFAGSVAMCYIGWRLSANAGIRKSPALRFPFAYMYASLYVSFGLMAVYELRNFLVDVFAPGRPAAILPVAEPLVVAPIEDETEAVG